MQRNHAKAILLGCVAVVAVCAAWEYHRGSRIEERFSSIHIGASESEVRRILGRPWRIEPAETMGNPIPNCTDILPLRLRTFGSGVLLGEVGERWKRTRHHLFFIAVRSP